MKAITFSAIALIALWLHGVAQADTVLAVDDENTDGAAINVLGFTVTDPDAVRNIAFDVLYETIGGSLAGELLITIEHVETGSIFNIGSTGNAVCSGFTVTCDADLGFPNASGDFLATGSFAIAAIANGAGTWLISLADSFDNPLRDGLINATFTLSAIPVPAAAWLFVSALGTIVISRRRF